MFASYLRLAIILAGLGTHLASAHARPLRVVVLDFDGHRSRSEAARAVVQELVADRDDLLSTRAWQRAYARAPMWGAPRWRRASQATGADAVLEGFVVEEGMHYSLTVVVRRASTGEHIDDVTVNVDPDGLSSAARRQLRRGLEDILDWMYDHPR
jgi:hypothetical protein